MLLAEEQLHLLAEGIPKCTSQSIVVIYSIVETMLKW